MTLLQMSAMGSVLIALTILLRKMLGDRLLPSCYLALWALAGVRLVLPVSISSPFSVYQIFSYLGREVETNLSEPVISAVLYEAVYDLQQITGNNATESFLSSGITMLWLCGGLLCFGIIALQHWRSRAEYSSSLPVENPFVLDWMNNHKLYRKYRIRVCQKIATPLTYGVICPVILLPDGQNMSDEGLHMVLLHERNHIRHFDTLWQWVLVAICSIHWFNPLVWIMFALCRQDMELCCDCATVKMMGAKERSAYAYLLIRQAEYCTNAPLFSQFCFTGYHRMEERVKVIMKQKPFSKKTMIVTVGLLCVSALCFATTAMGEVNSDKQWIDNNGLPTIQTEDTQFVWPVMSEDAEITLQYGKRVHPITGATMYIDHICIGGAEMGTDIIASASGVVKETGFDAKQGYYIVLQCENDTELHYGHCEKVLVEAGDRVAVYDKIATLGQTGDATGPCLSFAIYQNGEAVDPMLYFSNIMIND